MTICADEETFVLSDEIMDHIHNFFPRSESHHDRTIQACRALQALINVIGIMLCEAESEYTIEAVINSFSKMLEDVPAIRAEVESDLNAQAAN